MGRAIPTAHVKNLTACSRSLLPTNDSVKNCADTKNKTARQNQGTNKSELQADPWVQIKMHCQACRRSPDPDSVIAGACKDRARALPEFCWEAKISAKWI